MIPAVVLIQILALGHFFLAFVGIMNDSVPAFIILLVIGLLWECLFIHFVRIIRKQKSDQSGADIQAATPKVFAENLYDDHGLNFTEACELYCRQHGKTEKDLTKEEENIVWQYAYDDFTYLLMWIIEKGFYQPSEELDEEDAKEVRALAAKIKRREENPAAFLSGNDGVFQEDEIKKKARSFVIEYFNGSYMDELRTFAKEVLQADIHGFPFRWEDYDAFKVYIDQAYAEYLKKNSSKNTIEEMPEKNQYRKSIVKTNEKLDMPGIKIRFALCTGAFGEEFRNKFEDLPEKEIFDWFASTFSGWRKEWREKEDKVTAERIEYGHTTCTYSCLEKLEYPFDRFVGVTVGHDRTALVWGEGLSDDEKNSITDFFVKLGCQFID